MRKTETSAIISNDNTNRYADLFFSKNSVCSGDFRVSTPMPESACRICHHKPNTVLIYQQNI